MPETLTRERSPIAGPQRSLTQRMDALQHANDVRIRRAKLKRDVKAGRRAITPLLLNPPEYLQTAKVFDLLLAVPKYGRVKVNKALNTTRISPSKTIGGLSGRQRLELARWLGGIDTCNSCGAQIQWAVSEHGRRMPVDAEPVEGGTIVLSHRRVGEPPVALVQKPEQIAKLAAQHELSPQQGPLRLFVSHFATCPNADRHRKKAPATAGRAER